MGPGESLCTAAQLYWGSLQRQRPACGSSTSEMWFRHARQVIPESPAFGSGTSERWFLNAWHVIPQCLPSGSGVAGS